MNHQSEIRHVVESLNNIERKVLPFVDSDSEFQFIVKSSNLSEVEVMRGLQWLQNKNVLSISESVVEIVDLDINGVKYLDEGLPEKRLLKVLHRLREATLENIKNQGLSSEEVGVSIGTLKKKAAIELDAASNNNLNTVIRITSQGDALVNKESLEEKFLKKRFPIEISSLAPEERFAFEELRKRKKLIKTSLKKNRSYSLTEFGMQVKTLFKSSAKDLLDNVTSDMLLTGTWKHKTFRRYDIKSKVPNITGGRKQHYKWFLDEVREKLLSLGFSEMSGPIVESDFWDMDALFMPQSHSARDIHAGYYIKEPTQSNGADIPKKILERVKEAHEKGVLGSKGWGYEFSFEQTKKLLLRTQTTACSARTLASPNLKIPGKYFAIANNFRPDVVDAKHSCDFLQTEGIVIEEGLNLRHLFGLLEMFAREVAGAEDIKITPGYFPFTEPSCELFIKHPKLGWIELGGAGMFRPELVEPLVGRYVPVIAWGLGIPRVAMQKYKINDIRDLNSQDLDYLRNFSVKELI